MTTASTIAGLVTEMHTATAAAGPDEVMTAFGQEQAHQKHDLSFTVVSDPGNVIARNLEIVTRPSDEARKTQLQLGLDLTTVNADGTVARPMPTVAVVDAGHTVRWIDVQPDYSTRSEPEQILEAIDHLTF